MKTQVNKKRFAGFTFIVLFSTLMVFALINSVNANTTKVANGTTFEIEPWMVSETYWSINENTFKEAPIEIQDWMTDESYWSMDNKEVKEENLKIENWMYDNQLWDM